MKNSFVMKTLAVLLCAVSLLGIVGGTAGALVLADYDLYNKTVEEMLETRFRSEAAAFAEQTALSYASRELGGCPEDMAQRYGGAFEGTYGYTILDAEGNVLTSFNPELKNTAETSSFPVSGQYMHLVSLETESEKLARETAARMDSITRGMPDMEGKTLPAGGLPVNQVIFTNAEGTPIYEAYGDRASCYSIFYYSDDGNIRGNSRYEQEPQNQIGFLFYGTEGQLLYRSFLEEWNQDFSSKEVCGILFLSHETEFLFQAENPEGLGMLTVENGHLHFTGYPVEAVPEETVPPETVAETTAETVPEETAAETVAETQAAEEAVQPEQAPEDNSEDSPEEWTEAPQDDEEYQEDSSASDVPEEEEAYQEEGDEEAAPPETQPAETLPAETLPPETVVLETEPSVTEPVMINGRLLESYQVNRYEFYDTSTEEQTTAKYVYLPLPDMTVEVYIDQVSLGNAQAYNVLRILRLYRHTLLPVIGVCLLVFALTVVYLCTAAGRKPKCEEIRAGGLNRIPLDLYLGAVLLADAAAIALVGIAVPTLLERDLLLGCTTAVASVFACCLLITGFLFALIAQFKTPDGFWWRNLLCVRFVFLSMRFFKWLKVWCRDTCFPWLIWLLRKTWSFLRKGLKRLYAAMETFTARSGRILNRFFSLMPLTWQWLLGGFATILFTLLINAHNFLLVLLGILIPIAIVLYVSHCYGILLATTRKMGKGDLDAKIESKLLVGSFRDFADDLNDLADAATEAAQNQVKSERMKTELITNVSHDIKTPLTSIINYVDLLQKPHTEEEGQQYLEVLDRQSQRLKKLVEDLMDMSKASTGNMAVEITRVDAVESVTQALGEFADKLALARLYPVFRHAEDCVPMMADGKLVWRVLSNLLSNAVKYGMPGTRIYLDLAHVNDKVIISLKNISREELNVTAEELMERFVRGDVSRNTEGSGLGLNIAKSLMELQKGHLQLLVDGDLFKVTLIFPDAK